MRFGSEHEVLYYLRSLVRLLGPVLVRWSRANHQKGYPRHVDKLRHRAGTVGPHAGCVAAKRVSHWAQVTRVGGGRRVGLVWLERDEAEAPDDRFLEEEHACLPRVLGELCEIKWKEST